MSEQTRTALATMIEVAYAATQKGVLPDESQYPSPPPPPHSMTTETFYPTGQLMARTSLSWDANTPAIVDAKNARVELNPAQRQKRKQNNRKAKAARRATRK